MLRTYLLQHCITARKNRQHIAVDFVSCSFVVRSFIHLRNLIALDVCLRLLVFELESLSSVQFRKELHSFYY